MAVDYYQRLCRDIASSKEIIGRLEAMLPAFYEKAVAEEKAQEEALAALRPVPKARTRKLDDLVGCLPLDSFVYIETSGDKMVSRFVRNHDNELGFLSVHNVFYKSPSAFAQAHANRETEHHPHPTKPGNGWNFIRIDWGQPNEGKTIGELLDDYRKEH
jgi:hypothetical protein